LRTEGNCAAVEAGTEKSDIGRWNDRSGGSAIGKTTDDDWGRDIWHRQLENVDVCSLHYTRLLGQVSASI
jgi:hypothetical protein